MTDEDIEIIAAARWNHIVESTPNASRKVLHWDGAQEDAKETIRDSVRSDLKALEAAGYEIRCKTRQSA